MDGQAITLTIEYMEAFHDCRSPKQESKGQTGQRMADD